MAEAIGIALLETAGVIGATAATATAIGTAVLIAGSVAASAVQARNAKNRARAAYNASLKDRELLLRSAIAPRRVVLGRDRISGPIVYGEVTGSNQEYLHLVIALADGECDEIETIYFNEIALPAPDGSGYITSGEFSHVDVDTEFTGGTTTGGGNFTLPEPASSIVNIVSGDADIGYTTQTWSHTPGSATITGLPASTAVEIGYETTKNTPRVRIIKHLGQAGQVADATLIAESAGKWTSAHVGVGVCYLYVRLQYDPEVFAQVGVPNISCVVKGRKLYDPRTGTTVWSENAALAAAFWLKDTRFGLGASAADVPNSEVTAAANIADENVVVNVGGTTQKRYVFNGSFISEETPRDVLADILGAMAGTAVWVQGRWLVRPGAYRTPTLTITEDHLAGNGVVIVPKATRSDLFNAVRATYRSSARGYAELQAPLVKNSTYEAEDGAVRIVRAIRLPSNMNEMRAQRLAKIELERERQALTVQLTGNLRTYDLAPTDNVTLTLSRYGFASKVFEVRERTWRPEGTIDYTLRETASSVWAWAYGEATDDDLAPDTALPNPYARPATLTGLTVETGTAHLTKLSDGSLITRAWLQWTASTNEFVRNGGRIDIQWRKSSSGTWQVTRSVPGNARNAYVQPMPDKQAIILRIRAVNAAGKPGYWTNVSTIVVGKTALPVNVAGFTATIVAGGIQFKWTANTELDYSGTELHIESSWNNATVPLTRVKSTRFLYAWPTPGTITVLAKHRDTSGNYSATAASVTVTVDDTALIQTASMAPNAASQLTSAFTAANLSMPTAAALYTAQSLVYTSSDASNEIALNGSFILNVSGGGTGAGTVEVRARLYDTVASTLLDEAVYTLIGPSGTTIGGAYAVAIPEYVWTHSVSTRIIILYAYWALTGSWSGATVSVQSRSLSARERKK